MYLNVEIYNVEQRRINLVYFNVDVNNVRQRRNNVVLFNVEFYNVGQRGNNVVKMTISKKNKKKTFQINTLNSKFKLLFHNLIHFTPDFKRNILKNTCKAAKIKIMKKTALQELDLNRSSRPEVFRKKDVLRNFAKFTGKHL